ncbi:MAG: tRNA pseudouridine(55) synthase TruB [Gemmatimonadota bacterium]|jgi:tRNA pseudouridine55 synthase|nr:tRNA pseudouridine(55) synthase TruB [Gemmatimonadota bacterium]MDQ8146419.1 tRNA pseudouridine(55) synthase TruB [Gemmatimonadota bacterium]MDQ8148346.1 tRNA pseudouridine(55) synthase TruB [Gemmatimonadota bacterium]MDQ8156652.1 tRNA pseudouridine(55) synthase TruB [Gemmatimonadota bacterium]MDQ8177001.1 tRNA pseudouridine(55) synthase TruB [Gemmatimonadota bacterium]
MPRPSRPETTDGLLLVDKPVGVSSHDVVAVARRALGTSRIGHAGTLDPFATGLLVLLVGRATRLLPHLAGEPKVYQATIRFGAETDTEDLLGAVVREAERPRRTEVHTALPRLIGTFEQVPPAYSAKRVAGRRAYDLARQGEPVELAPVPITVHRWQVGAVTESDGRVETMGVEITCGGGTYVRSLARDLGRYSGSAAHLTALRRTASGPFHVADAVSLDALQAGHGVVRPALDALPDLPRQPLSEDEIAKVVRGIDVAAVVEGPWGALIAPVTGALVALAERDRDRWRPRVVMHAA